MRKARWIKSLFIILSIIIVITIGIVTLKFTNSSFRYNFDIIFNCQEEHIAYVTNEKSEYYKISVPLPPSTTQAFRHSDTGVTYYSKIKHSDFLQFYIDNDFIVDGNKVYTDDGNFKIVDKNLDSTFKYHFIDISLYEMSTSN